MSTFGDRFWFLCFPFLPFFASLDSLFFLLLLFFSVCSHPSEGLNSSPLCCKHLQWVSEFSFLLKSGFYWLNFMKYLPLQNSWLFVTYINGFQPWSSQLSVQGHLHNFQDPVQNENVEPLVQKQEKKCVIKELQCNNFLPFHGLSTCHGVFKIFYLMLR